MREKGSFAFILLLATLLLLNYLSRCAESRNTVPEGQTCSLQREYKGFFQPRNLYQGAINYIQKERVKAIPKLKPVEIIFLTALDLLLSLLSLWLTILLLTGTKTLLIKNYLWFLFMLNTAHYLLLIFFRGVWEVLEFLVIRLRPELKPDMLDGFSIIVIITAMVIYIWLVARTFNLNFYGAVGTFLVLHLICFLIIFFCFSLNVSKEKKWFNLAKENLGIKSVIRIYLSDINAIAAGQNILSLAKIRPFHL